MSLPSDTATEASGQLTSPLQLRPLLSCDILLDTLCRKNVFAAQFLHIVCTSPRLTVLDLGPIVIKTDLELYLLARTMSSIDTLRSLTLSIKTESSDIERVLTAVVKSYPSLVESLSLCIDPIRTEEVSTEAHGGPQEQQQDSGELANTALTLLGPITERNEPLWRLTDWRMVIESRFIDTEIFISLLKYLSELTSMDVPTTYSPNSWQQPNQFANVAHNIVTQCPKVTNLCKRHWYSDSRCVMPHFIIVCMQSNKLESIECVRLQNSKHDNICLDSRLLPHAKSLKRIVFEDCVKVDGSTPRKILRRYSELEEFRMSEDVDCRVGMNLADLGKQRRWAAVKLQELQLVLGMGPGRKASDPSTLVNNANPLGTWTPLLDSLYQRIADLRELRILDLRVSMAGTAKYNCDDNY
ncbi:hypothetical protein BG015_005642, partial [Linnemannia schmuckeri]